jgi:hypothetical protein
MDAGAGPRARGASGARGGAAQSAAMTDPRYLHAARRGAVLAALAALAGGGDAGDRPPMPTDAAPPAPAVAAVPAKSAAATPAERAETALPAAPTARLDSVPVGGLTLAVPLYPGAAVEGDAASRIELPGGSTLMLTLRSADPMAQVVGFYRDAMRARAASTDGAEFADLGDAAGSGGASLVLADTAAGQAVQVQVSATPAVGDVAAGSLIQIVETRRAR